MFMSLILRRGRRWHFWMVGLATAVAGLHILLTLFHHSTTLAAPGDPVAAIDCGGVYTTTVYAEGLISPDGLAFAPDGLLYVAEETAGRVSRVDATGVVTPVLTGLANPEGIAFDASGNLYVVEDVQNGRLIRRDANGVTTTLASSLDAPEGVAVTNDGLTVYVTESNAQFISDPTQIESHVTVVSAGVISRIFTSTYVLNGFDVEVLSFSGITLSPDGLLYVANELSGLTETYPPYPYVLTTTKSILTVDPATGSGVLFGSNLIGVEGLRFSQTGAFPLFAAEEDLDPNDDNIGGRLSQVDTGGAPTVFCTGFGNLEDVIVDSEGRFYVSEDVGGRIIRIAKRWPYTVFLPVVIAEDAAP